MVYAAGSHRRGFANTLNGAPPSDLPLHRLSNMVPGDVALHDGWTLHASDVNVDTVAREAIGLSYVRAGARFATRAELKRAPARWRWLSQFLDDPNYREGAEIDGSGCPAIALP